MSNVTKFQTSIAGYAGAAITLICALDHDTNVLVIAEEKPLEEARCEGYGMISNLDLNALDMRFDDTKLADAITAYHVRASQDLIDILGKITRHEPKGNAITKDGFDKHGPKYRLSPEITNGQIAVLAACAFAGAQSPIQMAIGMMDEMAEMYRIHTY